MVEPSPLSLLYLISDVVDVGAFGDFVLGHSLLPTYSEDSTGAPSLKTNESALYILVFLRRTVALRGHWIFIFSGWSWCGE